MKMTNRCNARSGCLEAQIAVFFAVGLTILITLVGLGVDVGRALSVKTEQGNELETISEACMSQANSVKFAQNPGEEARGQVVDLLTEGAYTGRAVVWYAEAPASETGRKDRYGGTLVTLDEETPTTLLGVAGVDSLKPASSRCWVTHAYSSAAVWRPPTDGAGWVEVTLENGRVTSRRSASAPFEAAPDELKQAVRSAM